MVFWEAPDLNGYLFTKVADVNIVFINNVLGIESKFPPAILLNNGDYIMNNLRR